MLFPWVGAVLGLAITFPEARRIYRQYGVLLAIVIWPFLSALIAGWTFAASVNQYNLGSQKIPIYFHVWHLLMIIVAPAAVAAVLGRKYNLSVGIVAGGILLACTFFFWVSMLFGYGTSGVAYR